MMPSRAPPHSAANWRGLEDSLIKNAIEIDRDRLYFSCLPKGCTPPPPPPPPPPPREYGNGEQRGILCGTDEYVYQHFFADFGPLHLGHLHAFCTKLGQMLERQQQEGGGNDRKPVYVYSSDHPHRRSNAAVLVLAYAVLSLEKTAEEAYTPFFELQPPLVPYRDASFGICTYQLEVLDCARAIARAASLSHFDLKTFSPEEYAFYDRIENGDLNWIIPRKFLAFSGPLASRREVEPGKWTLLAEDYVPIFRKLGVTCVIRFNKKCYDRRRFTEGGIKHVDLFYEDGGNPSEEILQRFLRICEGTKGAIAVHCKAGLGRTGTNIALYMMKHYSYTAAEAIALCRICRPGSIVGPQQQFLHDLEQRMKSEGELYRCRDRGGRVVVGGGGSSGHETTTRGSLESAGPPSALLPPDSRRHRQQSLACANSDARRTGGGIRLAIARRPKSSPLVMRRHSTTSAGGGGNTSGGAGGGATSPVTIRRRSLGNRWVGGEEGLVVSGGGGGGDGQGTRGGHGQGLRSGGGGGGGGSGDGRERGRGGTGREGRGIVGLRPRTTSLPSTRRQNGVARGGVGDLMEVMRLL